MTMNKRERVLALLDQDSQPDAIPAAFFLHFDPQYHRGLGAVDKHLEYFRYTGMDFVKIQFEQVFPQHPSIQSPRDWAKMPLYGIDFYQDQLDVVAGLVKAVKGEALVIVTLYSAFMCANLTTNGRTITAHLEEDPEQAKRGLEIIAESLMGFVKQCIALGVDGFYASTQGGESDRFQDPTLFAQYIKPFDHMLMDEANDWCPFNILHICDYHGGYSDLTPFLDYPGHVVNCPLRVGAREQTAKEISGTFARPYMGGLDRHGVLVSGSRQEIVSSVDQVLRAAPERFILGADCTLPNDIDWDRIRTAISTAHAYPR